ncbi:Hypothetical predicted protein [Prunus dulcis]|uniref:Uncharacterized protein n=1 Tax=Prunus dulcis TaxID=3755 RepID=A0A5E4F1H3_PRUDU|nr:Hypothetical predicted protein [Prunus dulcis]
MPFGASSLPFGTQNSMTHEQARHATPFGTSSLHFGIWTLMTMGSQAYDIDRNINVTNRRSDVFAHGSTIWNANVTNRRSDFLSHGSTVRNANVIIAPCTD